MADGPHYNADGITRREHNEPAMAKRVLQIGYDYENDEYLVPRLDVKGNTIVKDETNSSIEEKLIKIEEIMGILLLHAQVITGEEFSEDDFNIERG